MTGPRKRTHIPTHIDDEDPLLDWAGIRASLRQLLTVILSLAILAVFVRLTQAFVDLPVIVSVLLWSWIVILGLVFAFYKPYGLVFEQYLAYRILHAGSPRYWLPQDPNSEGLSFQDMDLSEEEER